MRFGIRAGSKTGWLMHVQVASQYDSEIYIMRDNKKVNAKSIMA